ncbi:MULTISPECIES: hypothetical protein [Bradyrhizobium]|uniref:hypothetical protein n=1 Tax=Bradyrhizobium TaxID=374 RepID=UPI001008BBB4|nr:MULTISPECIES: hypothetical protein [Bradyrhizobium]UQR60708.1 hypothetical protein LRP30_27375 [Bradyrhizobium sp. C-145]
MAYFRDAWPLAFVLVAANPTNAATPIDSDPAAFFQSGSLAGALEAASADVKQDEGGSGPRRIQLSQWFNFANCFSGVWRRC